MPSAAGFFVGYLVRDAGFEYLRPQTPECLVFAFVSPVGGEAHRRLVADPESLLRKTFAYIRWLTHRPPRFVFHGDEFSVMVRHQTMREWPVEKYAHFSHNFFIETLAWLVRSGLVRKLGEETLDVEPSNQTSKRAGKRRTRGAQKNRARRSGRTISPQ